MKIQFIKPTSIPSSTNNFHPKPSKAAASAAAFFCAYGKARGDVI
jgi:hypothetical protein